MTLYFEGRILPVTYLTVANLTRPIILAGFSTCSEGHGNTIQKYYVADGHTTTSLFKDS